MSRVRRMPIADKVVAALAVFCAMFYAGGKNGATNEPDRVSGPAVVRTPQSPALRDAVGEDVPTNAFLRIDALSFTNFEAVLPVSWTPGLLASGSVLSVWGATDALTNDFSKRAEREVEADGLTNAVLSVPFTNALHFAAFFFVRSNADADGDGLCDYLESVVFGSDPHSPDTNGDGFTDLVKYRLGLDPTNPPPGAVEWSPTLSSVAVCGTFELCSTNGIAGAFYGRTFAVGRETPYRQFFLSSSPTGSAPVLFGGLRIDYRDSNGFCGSVDSLAIGGIRLQLSTNAISSVTLEMHATGGNPWMGTPLYLVAYEPTLEISGLSGTCDVGDGETADLLVGSRTAAVAVDWTGRPSYSPLSQEELDVLDFFPGADGVRIVDLGAAARSPSAPGIEFPGSGLYGLPGGRSVFVLLPFVSYGVGHCYAGTTDKWSDASCSTEGPYTLDS